MANFKADMGLLESWSGFKSSVEKEVATSSSPSACGTRNTHRRDLQRHDQLPDDFRADLPLKRTWTLVAKKRSRELAVSRKPSEAIPAAR
jgi:restriction system protein